MLVPQRMRQPAGGRPLRVDERSGPVGGARVSGGCFVMGEAAGLGAALALRRGCNPADVDVAELQQALQGQGAYLGNHIA